MIDSKDEPKFAVWEPLSETFQMAGWTVTITAPDSVQQSFGVQSIDIDLVVSPTDAFVFPVSVNLKASVE